MHNHHDLFSPASPGRRFMAFFVDSIFAGIFISLIKVFSQKFIGIESNFLINLLVTIFYYAIPQHVTGQSIGKKIFDLKVISTDTESPPGVIKSIFRETFGKTLCIIIFGLGFVAILFGHERLGWHDRLFKTKVISLTQESNVSLSKTLGIGFATIFIILTAGLYSVFFTALPIKKLAQNLEALDIHLTGIQGSLYQGFSVDKLEFKNKSQSLELTQIKIKPRNHFQVLRLDNINFQEISAETLNLKIMKPEKPTEQVKELAADAPVETKTVLKKSAPTSRSILISLFKIKNISVEDEVRNIKSTGSEFSIENFSFLDSKSKIESLSIEAPTFNFALRDMSLDFESLQYELSMNGTLKTQFDKRLIKNIDFSGTITGKKLDLESVNLALFENKLRLYSSSDKKFILSMTAFTPGDYLSSATPFKQISSFVSLSNPMLLLGKLSLNGSMQLNNNTFRVTPSPQTGVPGLIAFANRGDENFEIQISNVSLTSLLGLSPLPKMNLTASRATTNQDHLARFYFGKNLANLTAAEQAQLTKETPLFELAKINPALENRIPASK